MNELSHDPSAESRKAHSVILQAMQDPGTQKTLAVVLGVSESTVSRIKSEKLGDALRLIYQLGFRIVPAEKVCVKREMVEMLRQVAVGVLADEQSAWQVLEDE